MIYKLYYDFPKEVFIMMVKKIICIAAMFLMSFGLCACWDAGRPFLIDLEYKESPYDVSDVTLKFSYGVKKSMIKEGLNDSGRYVYGDAHLFFTNEDMAGKLFDYSSSDIFLIKTIAREEFFSEWLKEADSPLMLLCKYSSEKNSSLGIVFIRKISEDE
jgi:hypothetical protein